MFSGGNEIVFQELHDPLFNKKNVKVTLARLDKVHPIISGNKLFKLHYFLEEALAKDESTIVTFGGAYSNHLVATAYACKLSGIRSIGIVRGERPAVRSKTLDDCIGYGMQLHFISRTEYDQKTTEHFTHKLEVEFGNCTIIPEGGYHPKGAQGASLIMDTLRGRHVTHVCTATGTGTTMAGLLLNNIDHVKVIAIPVLKNMQDLGDRLSFLTGSNYSADLTIFDQYHFGGYARNTPALISFMNDFYTRHGIPTDFVYTAKMMFAVIDQIRSGFFKEGSHITCLHTGGLQGNRSLPSGTLIF